MPMESRRISTLVGGQEEKNFQGPMNCSEVDQSLSSDCSFQGQQSAKEVVLVRNIANTCNLQCSSLDKHRPIPAQSPSTETG
mmetsp:Transcript_47866/g.150129  ORF Transcript_47866/g.150129 Transcript_47866/m.150129 type:complete len:82 (-) Transcript_47866:995-1240(-)